MAAEFLARGALDFDEPGVLMAFEETPEELAKNIASLGIDLAELEDQGKIFVDYVHVDRSEIEETGLYDLEGIFVRLADAISTEGARRVALDTIEALFSGFSDERILRAELRLYVAGQTPKSLIAFANLKRICEDHLTGKYSIEVVDLVENPRLARGDQILAIPTLVRKQPTPMRKIIGDLSNTERVLVGLDLQAVG